MLIALDYDGTYTEDPDGWLAFIKLMKKRGHNFVVVTMRTAEQKSSMDQRLLDAVPQVVTTEYRAKRMFCAAFGIEPDVWIDDKPSFLFEDSAEAKHHPLSPAIMQALAASVRGSR